MTMRAIRVLWTVLLAQSLAFGASGQTATPPPALPPPSSSAPSQTSIPPVTPQHFASTPTQPPVVPAAAEAVVQSETARSKVKDGLEFISTLVTLYYSAALLVGLGVAFLGWSSVKELRERARGIAQEVLADREEAISKASQRLGTQLGEAERTTTQLLSVIQDAKAIIQAKAAVEADEGRGQDIVRIWKRARVLPEKERLEMLSVIVQRQMKGPADGFHNAGAAAEFVDDSRLALQLFELGLSQHPNDLTLLSDAADTAGRLGDYEKAEAFFEKAVRLAPSNSRVWEFYIDYWFKHRDDPERARTLLEGKIDALAATVGLMREAGVVYDALGDLAKAEEYFRKGLGIEYDDHLVLNRLGLLLRRKGKLDEAAKFLRLATVYSQGHGNQVFYLLELGSTLFAMCDYPAALKAFLSAELIREGVAGAWIRRCQIEIQGVRVLENTANSNAEPTPDAAEKAGPTTDSSGRSTAAES